MRSRRLLADVAALGERASALKSGGVGVFRLGATPQVIETLLAGLLPRYRKRHPGVEVRLVEDGGASATISTWPSCQLARIGFAGGYSIRCMSWPYCRSVTA